MAEDKGVSVLDRPATTPEQNVFKRDKEVASVVNEIDPDNLPDVVPDPVDDPNYGIKVSIPQTQKKY